VVLLPLVPHWTIAVVPNFFFKRPLFQWKSMGIEICLIKTFFQISSFVYSRKKQTHRGFEQFEGE